MFKRSMTFEKHDDTDFAAQAALWGGMHEFGNMAWLRWQGKVIYRKDDRVAVTTLGNGLNDYLGFRAYPTLALITARAVEEHLEKDGDGITRCLLARLPNRIQASGTCIENEEDNLLSSCMWAPRMRSPFFYNSGFSVELSKAPVFITDMQKLRDLNPRAFCGLDAKLGVLLRYIKGSSAYLGKSEDAVDFDVTYYQSYTEGETRLHSDVMYELEQLALGKHGAIPHWGKNRNFAFADAIAKYPKAAEFLKVNDSEWSAQVLGINGSPNVVEKGCAIEGLCVCSDDSHCAPEKGYFCRSGLMYVESRVCSTRPATASGHRDEL
ncbi:hypothetical protein BRADI_3g13715v3 [Brachypodium distachyon]|uniref:L-gulonolactone oxidase 2-like C-terminal domain-containing protein n=1 Tax=Brachypodium distachyon TaxID=15368 RepID=A0A0Q3I2V1_BRADI|nr:hypothetical protein BRADI_3g13715v3 [Brachypodium distachyon]